MESVWAHSRGKKETTRWRALDMSREGIVFNVGCWLVQRV